ADVFLFIAIGLLWCPAGVAARTVAMSASRRAVSAAAAAVRRSSARRRAAASSAKASARPVPALAAGKAGTAVLEVFGVA
ncbi:hypothetical protein ACJH6J_28755, partial [Mycobacterium sp. SMC-18]|uniref:hypothetical protein n=1 Tax=Mycobacterium sp. SMC-18 TaxID=3381629 RepID=UPI003876967E